MPSKIPHAPDSRPRKSMFETLSEVLDYCRTPRKFTETIFHNSLRYDRGRIYFDFLMSVELLSEVLVKKSAKAHKFQIRYMTTEKGLKYIEALKVCKSYLGIQID